MSTKILAKLLGLFSLVTFLGMAANRAGTLAALNGFFNDPALMWVTGLFTAFFGLVVLVVHTRSPGSTLAAIVTLYGWIALIKGLFFISLPAAAQVQFYAALHFDRYYYGYLAVLFVLGAYLSYGGFKKESVPHADR